MGHKELIFDSKARETELLGATSLAKAVRVSPGPKSKFVLIGKKWGEPLVCNDGADSRANRKVHERLRPGENRGKAGQADGGVVVRVGAPSEVEMSSCKEALDDAISSTYTAVVAVVMQRFVRGD